MKTVCALALVLTFWSAPVHAQTKPAVDLALILAVDCSGSVDRKEFNLQLGGIASAFRDPEIIDAIKSGPHQKIAVNLLLWADPDEPKLTTGWFIIDSATASQSFANTAQSFDTLIGGGTGLGVAIGYSISLFKGTDFQATRQTIDVSGDGKESWELREPQFRLLTAQAILRDTNITVNGLAISNDYPDLKQYYQNEVIAGAGSFVIEAQSYEDFAEAMRIKLLREILPNTASR